MSAAAAPDGSGPDTLEIISAAAPTELDAIRGLIREFGAWTLATFHANDPEVPPAFAGLEDELATLPGKYAPPDGALFLACIDDRHAGCVVAFRHDLRSVEISRLWVRPEARGRGVGALLVQRALQSAKAAGYRRAVLRSHHKMTAAHAIYRGAGFRDMDGRKDFPSILPVAIAMERALD